MDYSKIIDGKVKYSDKVKTNIEDFFHIRFIMYREVYNHRKVRGLEHMMKKYLQLIEPVVNIKGIVDSHDIEKFLEFDDSIFNRKDIPQEAKDIVLRMKTRNIYKIVGEIELMDFDIEKNYVYHYEGDEKVVIDNIRIKYYGSIPCEYYSNEKYRKITNAKNKSQNIHILSVYSTRDENDEYAKECFDFIFPIRI
jgi:HD superfamily phosphohydrolase